MSKHTPGPWFPVVNKYGNIEIVTNERPYIHTVVSENECLNAADARLIAAAPEMLELLQSIVNDHDANSGIAGEEDAENLLDAFRQIHKEASRLVSKAAGE